MKSIYSQTALYARAQWTMSVLMCSLIVGFFIFGYRPTTQRRDALRFENAEKVRLLEVNQARAMNLPKLAYQVDVLRLKLEKNNKKMPKTPGLDLFINDTAQISSQLGIKKLMHVPGMMRRLDLYCEVPIMMSFEGNFTNESVFSFIRQLEEMQRLARVKNLTVRCKDAKLGLVDVNLAMNIYFSEL
jgi:Tfp pilus assembly protein PilO